MKLHARGVLTALVALAVIFGSRVARADETTSRDSEPRLIAPAIVGGAGLGLVVTSAILWSQWSSASDEARALAEHVPATQGPICADAASAQANPDVCALDREMRNTATAAVVTTTIGTAAIATAIVWTVLEVRRANRTREAGATSAHFTPTVTPQGAGAAFDVRF